MRSGTTVRVSPSAPWFHHLQLGRVHDFSDRSLSGRTKKRQSGRETIDEQDGFLETIRMHAVILLIFW